MLSVALLSGYMSQNLVKVAWSTKKLSAIMSGASASVLKLTFEGQRVASFNLPTSDLFNRSGERQINFKYLTHKRLQELIAVLPKSTMNFNGKNLQKTRLIKHPNALSLLLPGKQLFLVAPPHMETVALLLKQERRHKADIFFCQGDDQFCNEVAITNLGGLSDVKEAQLKVDSFFDNVVLPRGRFMGRITQLEITTKRPQTVLFRLEVMLPHNQEHAIKAQVLSNKAKYRFEKKAGEGVFRPATLHVMMPLKMGTNVLKIAFSNELKAGGSIPFDTTGLVSQMVYAPAPP